MRALISSLLNWIALCVYDECHQPSGRVGIHLRSEEIKARIGRQTDGIIRLIAGRSINEKEMDEGGDFSGIAEVQFRIRT